MFLVQPFYATPWLSCFILHDTSSIKKYFFGDNGYFINMKESDVKSDVIYPASKGLVVFINIASRRGKKLLRPLQRRFAF